MMDRWTSFFRLRTLVASASLLALVAFVFSAYPAVRVETAPLAVNADIPPMETPSPMDALPDYEAARALHREEQMLQLRAIIDDERTGAGMRDEAQAMLMEIMAQKNAEMTIEAVLRARGYPGAVATVHGDSVNIMIGKASVESEDAAIILELAVRETGVTAENVKIVPVK